MNTIPACFDEATTVTDVLNAEDSRRNAKAQAEIDQKPFVQDITFFLSDRVRCFAHELLRIVRGEGQGGPVRTPSSAMDACSDGERAQMAAIIDLLYIEYPDLTQRIEAAQHDRLVAFAQK